MTLKIQYSPDGLNEPCDKCNQQDNQPFLLITGRSPEAGRNVVWVHERCLEKSIAAAKKRATKARQQP